MAVFGRFLHAAALELERDVDRLTRLLPSRGDGRVRMLAYAGYRNATELRVSGRIVRFAEALDPDEGFVARVRAMAIYNSRELAGVTVRLEHDGRRDARSFAKRTKQRYSPFEARGMAKHDA